MQNTNCHWKTETSDLRARAADVAIGGASPRMSARTAARCLSGVVSHVDRQWSRDVMQRACAELVRCDATWSTSFRVLPSRVDTDLTSAVELIAVVSRGILPLAGVEAMRAALAFWATEEDPSVWVSMINPSSKCD
jgi:hypothetical protein